MTDNADVSAGGAKFDAGKIKMDLLPMDALLAVGAVLTYGAIKYEEWNWARGLRRGRLMAALMRHAAAYMMGEERDPESGLPHSWHMGCCALMLISSEARGVAADDRAKHVEAYKAIMAAAQDMRDPGALAGEQGLNSQDVIAKREINGDDCPDHRYR
ncbi:MAG: dATP/dGTP diphosphohydrolase domain-containing protein [Pseudomonadota bacterium]